MGMDFKKLFNQDFIKFKKEYGKDLDSNIDFRRVKQLYIYFSHQGKILTNQLIPNDIANLSKWQPGDIVIFDALAPKQLWHIGIITDVRRTDGVPYMIDNHGK